MDLKQIIRAASGSEGKAIPYNDALVAALNDDSIIFNAKPGQRLSQSEAGAHLQVYGGTEAIDWVMNCVRLIADTASDAPYHFERNGKAVEPDILLRELFRNPNPYQTYYELLNLLVVDLLLVGNHYWALQGQNAAGQPLAMYRLAPQFVKVIPGANELVRGYEYQLPGQDEPIVIPADQVLHFKLPNPHSPYYGMGVVKGGVRPLNLEIALTDTQASYYENGAHPSGVVSSDRRVPDAVFRKIKQQLRAMYAGSRQAGQLMILEAGLKYQGISPNASEAGFEALTKLSRDRILAMFRVPGPLLGVMETTEKVNEAQRIFDNKTMRPLLDQIQTAITKGVTQAWDLDFIIDYEYVMPPEERLKLAGEIAALPGIRVKEIREYAGFDPLGDERDDIVLNLPGEELEEGEAAEGEGFPDRNLPGEAGRPPNPENTRAFPEPGEAVASGAQARKSIEAIIEEMKALRFPDEDPRALTFTPPEDTLAPQRTTAVDAITARLEADIAALLPPLERALLDHADGKAFGEGLLDRIRRSAAWTAFTEGLAQAMRVRAREGLETAFTQTRGATPEGLDLDEIARDLVNRPDGAPGIAANLKERIINAIQGVLSGEASREAVESVIREQIEAVGASRAETIALTETTHAYNEGVLLNAEASGVERVYVEDGQDHDQPCIDAHGSIWTIEEARSRRLEHPRCRRAFLPLT